MDEWGVRTVGTNTYIDKLKARIDQLTKQVAHYKMLAQERNKYITVTEIDPESRTVEEFYIDADSVRSSWQMIRNLRDELGRAKSE